VKAGFWKDRELYIETYWSRFPDVWVHGDWAAVDNDRLWYILGRSDDTIKIAGKRGSDTGRFAYPATGLKLGICLISREAHLSKEG